jgi:hypothetical protein
MLLLLLLLLQLLLVNQTCSSQQRSKHVAPVALTVNDVTILCVLCWLSLVGAHDGQTSP